MFAFYRTSVTYDLIFHIRVINIPYVEKPWDMAGGAKGITF
jgi:hypothetical protein